VTSVACSLVPAGGHLWHLSTGGTRFWTPPHVLNYFGCVFAGIWSGAVILSATFGRNATFPGSSVSIWGLRGPLGAFLFARGGIAMLASRRSTTGGTVLTDWILKSEPAPSVSGRGNSRGPRSIPIPDVYRLPIDTEQIPYSFKDRGLVALLEGKPSRVGMQ